MKVVFLILLNITLIVASKAQSQYDNLDDLKDYESFLTYFEDRIEIDNQYFFDFFQQQAINNTHNDKTVTITSRNSQLNIQAKDTINNCTAILQLTPNSLSFISFGCGFKKHRHYLDNHIITYPSSYGHNCEDLVLIWFPKNHLSSSYNYIGCEYDGMFVNYYYGGEVHELIFYENGIKEGTVFKLYPSGKKEVIENYIDGFLEGKRIKLSENGDTSTIEFYKKGKLDSLYVGYYKNKQLQEVGNYNLGLKEGLWKTYYDNGVLNSVGNYSNNQQEGIWMSYYPSGRVKDSVNYINGHYDGLYQSYYENGQLKDSLFYIGKYEKRGLSISYFENGSVWEKEEFDSLGRQIGQSLSYFHNGQLSKVENYENNKLHGQSKSYNTDGTLLRIVNYKNNMRDGVWVIYFCTDDSISNGKLESKKIWKNDKLMKILECNNQDGSKAPKWQCTPGIIQWRQCGFSSESKPLYSSPKNIFQRGFARKIRKSGKEYSHHRFVEYFYR